MPNLISGADISTAFPTFATRTDLDLQARAACAVISSYLERYELVRTSVTSVLNAKGSIHGLEFPIHSITSIQPVGLPVVSTNDYSIINKRFVQGKNNFSNKATTYTVVYESGYDTTSNEYALLKLAALQLASLRILLQIGAVTTDLSNSKQLKRYKYKDYELELHDSDWKALSSNGLTRELQSQLFKFKMQVAY